MKLTSALLFAALLSAPAVLSASPAAAQARCPEGRTVTGQCINRAQGVLWMAPPTRRLSCPEGKTFSGACIPPVLGLLGRERGINIVSRKVGGPSSGRNMPATDVVYRDPAWLSHLRQFGLSAHGDVYIYSR